MNNPCMKRLEKKPHIVDILPEGYHIPLRTSLFWSFLAIPLPSPPSRYPYHFLFTQPDTFQHIPVKARSVVGIRRMPSIRLEFLQSLKIQACQISSSTGRLKTLLIFIYSCEEFAHCWKPLLITRVNFNSKTSIHKALGAHCAVHPMLDLVFLFLMINWGGFKKKKKKLTNGYNWHF